MRDTVAPCCARTSGSVASWYRIRALSPNRWCISARTIAVISSGVQDGPQPPVQHAVSAGKSKTSTVTTGSGIVPPGSAESRDPGTSECRPRIRCTAVRRRRIHSLRRMRHRQRVGLLLWGTSAARGNRRTGRRSPYLCLLIAQPLTPCPTNGMFSFIIPHRVYPASLSAASCGRSPEQVRQAAGHRPPRRGARPAPHEAPPRPRPLFAATIRPVGGVWRGEDGVMQMRVAEQLRSAGLELPPAPAALGAYVPAVRAGQLVFTAGQLPLVEGVLLATGRVPDDVPPDLARRCAERCALNALAAASRVCDLDQVVRVVKVVGYVASSAGFVAQPAVVDGASAVMAAAFGEVGRHAREAVGVAALPMGAPVEVSLVVEVG